MRQPLLAEPVEVSPFSRMLPTDADNRISVNPPPPQPKTTDKARRVTFAATPRLFNERKYHRLTVEHLNAKKWSLYCSDMFHTLVNMRTWLFMMFFLTSYIIMYCVFALMYRTQPEHCISNVHSFSHAMWFSVITAATIGYGHQAPNPDCHLLNLFIMAQVLTCLLMQAALLGLVYSRFAAPGRRAATIRFSSILACHIAPDGFSRLSFRVANLRHHQVLQPEVQLLMMRRERVGGPNGPLEYRYHELPLTHISGSSRLWLGVPSILCHRIDPSSPLFGATPDDVENSDVEFIALLDGIDETTSALMQARHSYGWSDIRWGESFAGVLARAGSGALCADYSQLDATRFEADEHGPHRFGGDMEGGGGGAGGAAGGEARNWERPTHTARCSTGAAAAAIGR